MQPIPGNPGPPGRPGANVSSFSINVSSFSITTTRKNKLYGDQDGNGETSGCSCSCPLTGDLSSSACVCGCVVNGVSATAAT